MKRFQISLKEKASLTKQKKEYEERIKERKKRKDRKVLNKVKSDNDK